MIISLWTLIPWCGVQAGPGGSQSFGTPRDVNLREPGTLLSRRGSGEARIGLAKRSMDPRIGRIGSPSQPRADFEPLRGERELPSE